MRGVRFGRAEVDDPVGVKRPVAAAACSVPVDPHCVPLRQQERAADEGRVAPHEERGPLRDALMVEVVFDAGEVGECQRGCREAHHSRSLVQHDRSSAELVSGQEDSAAAAVDERESEIAAEALDAGLTSAFVGSQDQPLVRQHREEPACPSAAIRSLRQSRTTSATSARLPSAARRGCA